MPWISFDFMYWHLRCLVRVCLTKVGGGSVQEEALMLGKNARWQVLEADLFDLEAYTAPSANEADNSITLTAAPLLRYSERRAGVVS